MDSFWTRLRERKIVQWVVGYAAVAYVALELSDILGGTFGWTPGTQRVITVLVAFSLLAAVVVAWYHGERGHQRVTPSEILILASLAVIAGFVAWQVYLAAPVPVTTAGATGDPPTGLLAFDRSGYDAREAEHSVVVLPFQNFTNDPEQDYFADGMTEDVISYLGAVDGLRVISRTTAMRYRDSDLTLPEIAAELGVESAVEGSTRLYDDRIQVNATLIDTQTDAQIWNAVFDTTAESVFAIQAEIAREIAGALEAQLSEFAVDQFRIASDVTVDPEAYSEFALGRQAKDRGDLEGALQHFQAAYEMDSTFVPAIDEIRMLSVSATDLDPAFESLGGISDLVAGAMALAESAPPPAGAGAGAGATTTPTPPAPPDPEQLQGGRRGPDPEGIRRRIERLGSSMYIVNAMIARDSGDIDRAIDEARTAVSVRLNDTQARSAFAHLLALNGQQENALVELRKAESTDPRNVELNTAIGSLLYGMHRSGDAVRELEQAIADDGDSGQPQITLALVYADLGQTDRAIQILGEVRESGNERAQLDATGALGYVLAQAGRTDEAAAIADSLEERIESAQGRPGGAARGAATQVGLVHLGLGNTDDAIQWLERGSSVGLLLFDPKWNRILEPLQSDERFNELRTQVPQRGGRGERGSGRRGSGGDQRGAGGDGS